ncbi:ybaK/ebsC family protein [Sporosarcina sp. FSL K6-1522]|uniref:DUF6892 domain-containing protein n=1 Tax=Sporosarcina sp. FSL K6-1522 TaxID=2921554 RepID=UPI00315A27D4
MQKYQDETGMFEDFNFKLVVIDALLDEEPSFKQELAKMKETYCDSYEWYTNAGPIREMCEYFATLTITPDDLIKITQLCFDGGNEIYFYIQPDWDGEDGSFDVHSVSGFEKLTNLATVTIISMIDEPTVELLKQKGIDIV